VLLAIADRPMLRRPMIRAFRRHPALFESLLAYNSEPTPRALTLRPTAPPTAITSPDG